MKLTLDYKEYRRGQVAQQLEESNLELFEDSLFDRITEIDRAHIGRKAKTERLRRALRRHGYTLSVINGNYGVRRGKSSS